MTQLAGPTSTHFDRTRALTPLEGRPGGGIAPERGRITRVDGTVVAESLQTRHTAQD